MINTKKIKKLNTLLESLESSGISPKETENFLRKLKKYCKQHHKFCEYNCKGKGFIRGKHYSLDQDEAFIDIEESITVFDGEIKKIEKKINQLVKDTPLDILYQYDPRGYTVKIMHDGSEVQSLLW